MFRQGLIKGDPQAINMWNRAIARNADFAQKFTSNSIVDAVSRGGLTPSDVAKILTRTTGKNTERVGALTQIKDMVGEDSAAWQDLRSEWMGQLFSKGQTDLDMFDPVKFAPHLKRVLRDEPEVMNMMFSQPEIQIMKDLARITPRSGRATLLAGVADLISLRYGVQGNAIAGSFRRTANRLGAFVEGDRPLLAGVGATSGAIHNITPAQVAVGELLQEKQEEQ